MSHANHNKEVCEFLHNNSEKKCNDWVVTTAYYSAYHFIKSTLFPGLRFCHDRRREYDFHSFEEYYRYYKKVNKSNRHDAIVYLTENYLSEIADEVQFLKDSCIEARYHDYNVKDDKADESVKELRSISDFMVKYESSKEED